MLSKLFFITGLYIFLSSAKELEGFKDLTNKLTHSQVVSWGLSVNFDLLGETDEGINQCAKTCLAAKYWCKVFIVTSMSPDQLVCMMFKIPASQFTTVPVDTVGSSVIFETFEPEPLEPVVERFFYDYKMPENDWAFRLVNGYCLTRETQRGFLLKVIGACKTVMYGEPARAINFEKWTFVRDISESQRPISELDEFSDHKILEGVKSWEWEEFSEIDPSESFGTLLFTFLDIICPHLRQGTTTIYDPIEKVLFIDNEDVHILVASFGPDQYAIVRDQPKFNNDSKLLACLTKMESDHGNMNQKNALNLFQQAMNLKTNPQCSTSLRYNTSQSKQWQAIQVLVDVLQSLIEPELGLVDYNFPSPSGLTFYRDLVTAVLSHIYGKKYERTRIFSMLKMRLQSNELADISVSYQK